VRASTATPGATTGVTQTGIHVGIVVGPLSFGALVAVASYSVAWLVTAGLAACAAAAVATGRYFLRQSRASESLIPDHP